jgi:hypothetical protein
MWGSIPIRVSSLRICALGGSAVKPTSKINSSQRAPSTQSGRGELNPGHHRMWDGLEVPYSPAAENSTRA